MMLKNPRKNVCLLYLSYKNDYPMRYPLWKASMSPMNILVAQGQWSSRKEDNFSLLNLFHLNSTLLDFSL